MQYKPVSQVEKFKILKILKQKNTKISSHELNFYLNVANREKTIDADPDSYYKKSDPNPSGEIWFWIKDIYGKCPEICTGMPGEDIKINLDFLILGKHNYIF